MFGHNSKFENELVIRGVFREVISDGQAAEITKLSIAGPDVNKEVMKLEKAPKIAVYSPKTPAALGRCRDMVLTYAEIPYTIVFDDEVMYNELPKYDWLHLHQWKILPAVMESFMLTTATSLGISGSSRSTKLCPKARFQKGIGAETGSGQKIRDFVPEEVSAMCSATDTYDIAWPPRE